MAKKKSNPQSEDAKPPKTQHQPPPEATDDSASEKLHSLKSLNAMLLKETFERRQQVDSLTQVNESLESDLIQCKNGNVSLNFELNGVNEQAVMLEIQSDLVSKFIAAQMNQMAEFNRRERAAMEEKIGGLERDMNRVLVEKNGIERVKNNKEAEIGSLNTKLKSLAAEIAEEKFVLSQVSEERDEIRAQLDDKVQQENKLKMKLVEAEKRESVIMEKSQKLKVDYDRKLESILREKDSVERNLVDSKCLVDELNRDIRNIMNEKIVIEDEKNILENTIKELQVSVDGLNQLVHKLQKGEEQLLEKVSDLEKKCVEISEKEAEMSKEIDTFVKEKQQTKLSIQKLTKEKDFATKELTESAKMVEHQKLTINQMIEEKTKLNEQLGEFKNMIPSFEKSSRVQGDKIKQLESEVSRYTSAFDQATTQKNKAQASLDEEKLKVKKVTENLSKMEKSIEEIHKKLTKSTVETKKLVSEKQELEKARSVLQSDILAIEKSLEKTRKERDDEKHNGKNLLENLSKMEKTVEELKKRLSKTTTETEKFVAMKHDLENSILVAEKSAAKALKERDEAKAKLERSEANSTKILKILKNTSLICNSKEDGEMDMDQETKLGEDMKHHVIEIEAIKKGFKDLKKQLELLKESVAKADKGKSFWTMVSSATTLMAAISLAYVAKGH